ncbi:MAG: aminotransferase class V-fold PLP-dependent enzyme [candidate division Zixibacteria bacterium]|nr:aminotransferase class V-fold PLP-dependent enzyme [candidate division Zixibacteria bacterium]
MVMKGNGMELEEARNLFPLLSEYTYLNNAGRPPLAVPVRDKLEGYLEHMMHQPVDDPDMLFTPIESCRNKLASLFGCARDEIALTPNTSYGLNVAAFGLGLKAGDSVAVPDMEFPANLYPFAKLRDSGVNLKLIKGRDGIVELSDIEAELTPDVKLMSISWVQFFNGVKNDIREISRLCSEREVFFSVDGIQGAGSLPLNLSDTDIDLFSSGAEKWLLCPCGIGFTYLSSKSDHLIRNNYAGWLGVDWGQNFSSLLVPLREFKKGAARLEVGTYPYQEVMAFDAALDIITGLGIENIANHIRGLLDKLLEYLQNSTIYRIVSPLDSDRRSSIICFTCENVEQAYNFLGENRIITSLREGAIRIAPHFFNNMDDINWLIEILQKYERGEK